MGAEGWDLRFERALDLRLAAVLVLEYSLGLGFNISCWCCGVFGLLVASFCGTFGPAGQRDLWPSLSGSSSGFWGSGSFMIYDSYGTSTAVAVAF